MAAVGKRNTNLARRRRTDDEDDGRSVATLADDDSQSDTSALSDVDAEADAEVDVDAEADADIEPDNTDVSEVDSAPLQPMSKQTPQAQQGQRQQQEPPPRTETLGERRRREHDEYKKKRDSDPAFIPNRGAFFMHDHRHAHTPAHHNSNSNNNNNYGLRHPGGGRGRGRHPLADTQAPVDNRRCSPRRPPGPDAPEATDALWQHDLHHSHETTSQRRPAPAPQQPPPRNFSATVHTHNAVVRVCLPGAKARAPVLFQNVPIKQHTRLPNHRPPLRRDKPVRVSLPPAPARYIFPTVERSFIFIPRAMRPNQQGFGRGRGRFGSFGPAQGRPASRPASLYAASAYSPSVAMSRRSSMARDMGRDTLASPAGSTMSRNGAYPDPNRPVVRLPPGGPRMSMGPCIVSPTHAVPNYPLPQKPAFRENWQGQLPMHQPRPQKTVSVAGIESPTSMSFNPPQQQEQQPFHHQVPAHVNHSRQLSYPSQVSAGTPLSNIPERAIHAPAFQPYAQPNFAPPPFVPQPYYYPPPVGPHPQPYMVPVFVSAAQPPGYVLPASAPPVAAPPVAGPPNMVAYESNGMTYYVDSASLYPGPLTPSVAATTAVPPPVDAFAQPSFAVPGMGGMMTPGPDGAFYYPQGYYAS